MSGDESSGPGLVPMTSDVSVSKPLLFGFDESKCSGSSEFTAPSVVPLKSKRSIGQPLNFGLENTQSLMSEDESSSSSCVSDASMDKPLWFGVNASKCSKSSGNEFTAPSVVSMRSNASMDMPLFFSLEKPQSKLSGELSSCSMCMEVLRDPVRLTCGHWSCRLCFSSDCNCMKCGKKLRKDPEHQRETEEDTGGCHLLRAKKNLTEAIQKKFTLTSEGYDDQQSSLNSIYTTLHITTGESEGPHDEHSFRRIKPKLKLQSLKCISLSDIFKPLPGQEKPHRTVLTKGVAGIGKSFSVQKFILDWAEGKANKDIDFIFSFALRELNLSTDNKSLQKLLTEFHPAIRDLTDSEDFIKAKVVVILDGLDENRLQLDFRNKKVTSVSEVTSVGNLLANVIQGNLLPNANVWITSRPAAASQIPAGFIDMVTEIRGFSDPQKEEYFKRRFTNDPGLADRIISHIRSSQSLDIMCQIPIFCWISAVLFQEIFGGGDEKAETPQTLTEMMAYFLFAQTKRRSRKYDQKTEENKERLLKTHREFLLKLGKLAFVHLQKNNLILYAEDLEDCGIDVEEATIYSGFCNTILREEQVFSQKKIFFFVHLTIQEFFAALFVYDCFTNNNTEELDSFLDLKDKEHTLLDLVKMTVDKVLEKKNGHLDFFLRFLLGLMVEPNRRVLQGLLTSPEPSQDTNKKILTYLKAIQRKTLSPDSCMNLFQTTIEMRDHKVKDEIQEYLKSSDRSKTELTPLHCSALAYMLLVSKDHLDVLDLKSYSTSDKGRRRLIPAVRISSKAILADCKVTEESIQHLAFGLKFPYSPLRDLDLSNNDLKDSGVKLLCEGLSSQYCKLRTLRLSGCQVTEEGCVDLASALRSNPSHLTELDLSYNNPGDSGEKLLSELRENPQYKLNILNVEHGGSHRMRTRFKKYACELTLDPNTAHKNLLLSKGNRKVTWVQEEQPYPHHQERFDNCQQVLCQQGLDGRCYWEMEVLEPFTMGLTYRSIGRKGDVDDCKLGRNDRSWCLICSDEGCFVLHHNESVSVSSLCSRSSRVGVYLDWPAGTLSFYRVSSDSWTRLHTFKATFSEPLYPAVELHTHSSALFCHIT